MKVGVDAVLLGAWAAKSPLNILDVGTGCGVISLMLAQRFPMANILAIDIDPSSIYEAKENFKNSKWSKNLCAIRSEFPSDLKRENRKFDLIVSNPPFFKSGIIHPSSPREKARHQDTLSAFTLIEESEAFLTPNGKLAMIFPFEFVTEVKQRLNEKDLKVERICNIRDREDRPVKRVMIEVGRKKGIIIETEETQLTLFKDGRPTDDYRNLCKDFYLKF